MKTKWGKILGALVFACALLAIFFAVKIIPSKISGEKAEKLFNQAGGEAKVNQEAKMLFDRFRTITNGTEFLHESDLRDFPTLSKLGSHVLLTGGSHDDPPLIAILVAHTPDQWFCIFPVDFDLNKISGLKDLIDLKTKILDKSKSFQIASNIFFLK